MSRLIRNFGIYCSLILWTFIKEEYFLEVSGTLEDIMFWIGFLGASEDISIILLGVTHDFFTELGEQRLSW